MSAPLRKGWCPGALRPMPAKDGLLVRIKCPGGRVTASQAKALADLARREGNGLLDLSARANLQMRGIGEAALPLVQGALADLGLIDADAAGEAVRNVIGSPLAGLHDGLDIRPLVRALEHRLATDPALHALPNKFGFLIDDGHTPSLAGISTDVRFDWSGDRFLVALAGSRQDAVAVGTCAAADLVERAVEIATTACRLFAGHPNARRLRHLRTALGPAGLRQAFGGDGDAHGSAPVLSPGFHASSLVGTQSFGSVRVLGLAAPFGRLDASVLLQAAERAEASPIGEVRLTPWRVLLIPEPPSRREAPVGFITDPQDPRLFMAACSGREGCVQASTSVQSDATRLARLLGRLDRDIHVSGCAKGCAKPSASFVTLVGRDGRYDLVHNGDAAGEPDARGLDLDTAAGMIAQEVARR